MQRSIRNKEKYDVGQKSYNFWLSVQVKLLVSVEQCFGIYIILESCQHILSLALEYRGPGTFSTKAYYG